MALKFPIGIQTFADIINGGFVYVDKTALVHQLANAGKFFFLSRPRRFGKSLLLSTLHAYFTGRRDLFRGLALEQLEQDWDTYPVLRVDLNNGNYTEDTTELNEKLNSFLRSAEEEFKLSGKSDSVGERFAGLIRDIHARTGKPVVVLIDEYDKPLVTNIERGKTELQERMRAILKSFYGTLKTCDEHLRFVILTGVSRFSKLSLFSDLNNLRDISMNRAYNDICGISEQELHLYLDEAVELLADNQDMAKEQAYDELKRKYDGYRFSEDGNEMYNPWSVLHALDDRKFSNAWSESGTPTFLIKMLRDRQIDLSQLDCDVEATETTMMSFENDGNFIAPLYQTGYLTIKDYDKRSQLYTLGFPNREVERTFNHSLLTFYTKLTQAESSGQHRRAMWTRCSPPSRASWPRPLSRAMMSASSNSTIATSSPSPSA